MRDLATGTTEIVDVSGAGVAGTGTALYPAISADGRYVAYESTAADLVAGDTNASTDVFVRDRTAGTTTRVSVATDGTEGDDDSEEPSISADGNRVAFSSYAETLVGDDYNVAQDIFVRDLTAGTTIRASIKSNGDEGDEEEDSYESAISADGSTVAFVTYEPFVSDDLNEEEDVYVRELATNKTRLVSRRNNGSCAGRWRVRPTRHLSRRPLRRVHLLREPRRWRRPDHPRDLRARPHPRHDHPRLEEQPTAPSRTVTASSRRSAPTAATSRSAPAAPTS